MTINEATLKQISPGELDEVIARVRDEKYLELALLGHKVMIAESAQHWPEGIRDCDLVFQLTEPIEGISAKIFPLNDIEKLFLIGLQVGDGGAQHIGKLANLTTLQLAYNGIGEGGAQHIAKLANLTTLDLAGNGIGDGGAQHSLHSWPSRGRH